MKTNTAAISGNAILRSGFSLKSIWDNAGMLVVFLILFLLLSIFVPYFFTVQNIIGLFLSVSMIGMVASTMLFCLGAGEVDLSVEGIVVLAGVLSAVIITKTGNIFLGILSGLFAGGMAGLISGLVVAKLRINSLITTLAMLYIVKGVAFITSNGSSVGINKEDFFVLGNGRMLSVPNPIWITFIIFIIFGFLLNRTTYGRNTMAIGGNKEAARLAGINVDRIKILIFTIQGLMSGLAGIVLASRMTSGQPNSSAGFALDCISACVLGGVSLMGGVGTMVGTIVGVMIMGSVQNAMNLLGKEGLADRAVFSGDVMYDSILHYKDIA